jgi:FixJ family two-component response regulator
MTSTLSADSRGIIVIIDDDKSIQIYHSTLIRSIYGNRYECHMFESDDDAERFVRSHSQNIVGFIQDIRRPGSWGGIRFYTDVIKVLTPHAKCLIISGSISQTGARILLEGEPVVFFDKPFRELEIVKTFEWFLTPFAVPSARTPDRETVSIVTSIGPPWRTLCNYIVSHQEYLHTMSSADFEALAGDIFRSYGWTVDFTSKTKDGGYDIVAVRSAQPTNLRVLVEAKRYSPHRPVGVELIRSLYGIKQSKAASQLVLVTSSTVSLDAKREFARVTPWELDFFERDKILDWCRQHSSTELLGEFKSR